MRKTVLFYILLLFLSGIANAQYKTGVLSELNDSEVVAAMKEHVGFLASAALEGRKAGSEGEREAARYISEVLSSYGVDVLSGSEGEDFGIKQENGDTLHSCNVISYIPGYDKKLKDRYIVIAARLDNMGTSIVDVNGTSREKIFYGANGNASGLALLMQIAKKLSMNSVLLKRSVIIAAFGSSLESGAGAWYFLNRSFSDVGKIDAMINLDMLGTASLGFYAYTASNGDLNKIIDNLSSTLQPILPQVVAVEPVNSIHRIFYDKEIPSVFFTTGMYPEYNSDRDTASILEYDDMEREAEYIYHYALELINAQTAPEFRPSDDANRKFTEGEEIVPYYECDVKPQFFGSSDPSMFMQKWVYVYLRYPDEAVNAGIQGKVLVDFVIDERGKVTDVKIIKGLAEILDNEVIRVVSASPDWKPARQHGRKVKCEMSLYVEFRLEKRN